MSYARTTESIFDTNSLLAEEARILSYAANYQFSPASCMQVSKLTDNSLTVFMVCKCNPDKTGRRFYELFFHKRDYRCLRVQKVTLSEAQYLSSPIYQEGNITYVGQCIKLTW